MRVKQSAHRIHTLGPKEAIFACREVRQIVHVERALHRHVGHGRGDSPHAATRAIWPSQPALEMQRKEGANGPNGTLHLLPQLDKPVEVLRNLALFGIAGMDENAVAEPEV